MAWPTSTTSSCSSKMPELGEKARVKIKDVKPTFAFAEKYVPKDTDEIKGPQGNVPKVTKAEK